MNHVYRLCWNRSLRQWVAASELATSKRGGMTRSHAIGHRVMMLSLLSASLGMTGLAHAGSAPSGGQIVGGSGQIQQSGNTTTITQNSQVLSLNWQNFDIGADQTVNFVQPGSSSIAVNRILGNTATDIYGHLNANGQVWLINPNGVLFGQGAQVNVGGIVASTLDVDSSTIGSGSVRFAGDGKGQVVNKGSILAANGGYVALVGNQVSNQGVVRAQLGMVALGGGSAVTLTFQGSQLLHLQVDKSTINNLVENRQLIVADGGTVLMTAGARDSLLNSVVNNTGTVQARTVQNHNGTITLLGGMEAGSVQVGGNIDASAPNGGDGGKIETSAAHFQLAADAHVTAAAASGKAGTWLVDPVDLTIDATAANTISGVLQGGTSVTEQTTATSANELPGGGTTSGTNGDITIAAGAAIAWSNAASTLELDAFRNINVNGTVNGAGGLVLNAASGTLTIGNTGGLSAGTGATLQAAQFVNNATASALGSKWMLYSVNPTLNTLGGLAPGFIQYNASRGSALAGSGNGLIYSVAPTLQINSLTGTLSKFYDGTTSANNFTGANFNASGLLGGDAIVAATGGSYASVNAANGLSVNSPGAIGNFSIANNGVPVYGYTLGSAPVSGKIGQITPKQLSAQIVGDPTKVYDGTRTATLNSSNYEIDGFVGSDSATVKQPSSISYGGSDAGSQMLTAFFSTANFTAGSGTLFSNYVLPTTAIGTGMINPAPLLISGLLANNKVYDGSTLDSIDTSRAKLFGVIQPDIGQVLLDTSGAIGTFASANVGNGIGITLSGFGLTGNQSHNYTLQPPITLTANITPKTLTISQVTANDKTYNNTAGTTLNTGSAVLGGVIGSDNVTLNVGGASALFGQTDAGNNLAVTTSGFTLSGTMAGNYALSQPVLSANINPALLTISMIGTPEKTYDGTDAVTLGSANFNISGFIGTQHATIFQSSANYASPNAGHGIDVTATLQPSDFSVGAGTSMANYTFATTITGSGVGVIDPLQLIGLIVNNPTKVYDGTTSALLGQSNLQLAGLLPGQSISANFSGSVGGTYSDPYAGARGVTSGPIASADFSAGAGTLLSNYLLPTIWTGSGSITPAPLTGGLTTLDVGIINASKIYDGNMDISLLPGNFTLSGWIGSDNGVVAHDITGTFGQADVGNDIPLSAVLHTSDIAPTGSTNLANYAINLPVLGLGDITPRQLMASIIGGPTKVYNGSVQASLSSANFSITGWATGEGGSINPTATASYDSADAGTHNIVTTLAPGNYVFNSNTKLSNYDLAYTATGTGSITQAPLFITGVFATNKTYDASTTDALNTGNIGLAGLVSSDAGKVALDLSGVVANFAQKNVGNGIVVSASGFAITGSESTNYLLQPIGNLAANITKATLTLTGVSALDKTYDGTTTASFSVDPAAALHGIFAGDTVGFDDSGAFARFSTANAGTNLDVSTGGFTLNGGSASNYQLSQPGSLIATINPKQLTAVIIGSPTKVYDGTDSATLTAADYELDGFITGQGASVPQSATANYVTKNVGSGLGVESTLVTSDFLANAGTDLSNYILPTTGAGNRGVITPKVLDLTATRVYDGTDVAIGSLFGTLQGVNGETVNVGGSTTLASRNVGSQWAFAGAGPQGLGSLVLTNGGNGGLGSNYTLLGGTDWVSITPKALSASFGASDKIYDATSVATLTAAATLTGLIAGDKVTLDNSSAAHFSDKNVGTAKTVTGDMSISGDDAGNYTFTEGTTTASITPLSISVTATGKSRQYDGSVNDPGTTVQSAGVLAGDQVSFGYGSATFGDKNVGAGKTVTVSGVTKSGTDAGNYTVSNTTVLTVADITPRIINLSGSRVYDGTNVAASTSFGTGGVINTGVGSETLNLVGTGSTANKNALNNKAVTLGTLALANGSNGGVFSNYALGTATLSITKRALTATFTATDKIYDGTTADAVTGALLEAANGNRGLIAGDLVMLTNSGKGTFNNKNVGTGKTVTGAMGISGTDSGNYTFTNGTSSAAITKANLTVLAQGSDKTYDGSTTAAVTLSGGFAGDNLTFSDTSANYDGKNAGAHSINVAGISVGGTDAGNYVLQNTTALTTGNINQVVLNLSGSRIYDGSANANASLFGNSGVLNGVNGETVVLSGVGAMSDKNVARDVNGNPIAKTFALGSLTLSDGGSGGLAQNYTLANGIDRITVTPAALTATATAQSRVYDGTTNVTLLGAALSGLIGSDQVVLGTDVLGTFANKNVGTSKAVTTHMTVTGSDAGNYTFTSTTGLTADVTPRELDIVAHASDKQYDTTTTAGITGLDKNGLITGDQVNVAFGSANFSDANAADNKTVTVAGLTKTGTDAGNYSFGSTTVTTLADITPIVLNLSGSRIYDGSANAASSLFGTNGVLTGIHGQTVVLSGTGLMADKNVARDVNGNPIAKSFALGSLTLSDGGSGGLAQNYTLANGTDRLTVTPAALTATATAQSRVYDGTTNVTLLGAALSGLIGSDQVVLGSDVLGTFANKNVGNSKAVTTHMTVTGSDVGNYTFTTPTALTANVTPRELDIVAHAVDKQYDTTTAATVTGLDKNGLITGDNVLVNFGSANFSDANAADNKTVTVAGLTKTGTDAGNYSFGSTTVTTLADITPIVLNLSGSRVYDGSVSADAFLFGSNGVLAGINGQTVTLIGSGHVHDKNVGSNKAFADLGTLQLQNGGNGGLAQNYTLANGIDTLSISPKALTAITTAVSRDYDGSNVVALSGSMLSGLVANDDVTLANATQGTFADKNAGTGKAVSTSMTISGGDIGNYSFTQPLGLVADINPLHITVGVTAADKQYDTNSTAIVTSIGSTGVLGNDDVHFTFGGSSFSDANAANNKTVTVTGINKNGTDAGNYAINTSATTLADITPIVLDLTGSRIYDGSANADASVFGNGVLSGIAGQTVSLIGSGHVSDKNVGNNKLFADLGTLQLQDGSNGGLAQNYTLLGGVDKMSITPKALTAITTAVSRDYDGSNVVALSGSMLSGLVANDDVTLGNAAQGLFADKNAGTGKAVSTSMTISGGDIGNYSFTQPLGLVADINPLHITVDVAAANKNYDTTTDATLTAIGSNGILGNDDVHFVFGGANFSDANAANSKTVTVTGIAKSGIDAGNYAIDSTATTTADILPLVIDLSGSRVYDGSASADASLFGANGVLTGIAGQTINLVGSGNLGDKNVGGNKAFAGLGTLQLQDGGNGGLAQNYTLVGGIDTLSITPKAITLGASADNKVYDATDLASAIVFGSGIVSGDDIQFAPGSATFASANAGNGIAVNIAGINASGADAGNYSFTNAVSTSANITPVVLDLSGTRVYDGGKSADANLFGVNGVLAGVAGQTIDLIGSGVLGDKNVGGNKPFAGLGTLTLQDGGNGGLAQNYTLIGGIDALSITPRAIVVDATGSNRIYDGGTAAGVTLASSGVLGNDQVRFTPGSANYVSPNAGNGIAIDVTGITAGGADAGNYVFINTASTSGNITPVVLSLTGSRVYDGSAGAAASLFGNHGVLTGVNGETLTLSGSGTLGDKNVGNQKAFASLAGLSLSGNGSALAGNYTLAGGTDWLSITPATLVVVGTQTSNRVYDGSRIDALSGAMLSGVFGNDDVLLGNASTGLFDSRNVGSGKAVTTAMTISGSDVGNYILLQPTGLAADVTPRVLTVSATGSNKMFDGNPLDSVTLAVSGVVAGDQVDVSHQTAVFSDSNVGNGKTVTVSGLAANGADASNYVIAAPTITTTADITGAQPSAFGISGGTLAQLQGMAGPASLATPYGVAEQVTVGPYSGNKKNLHRPIERNHSRDDFTSGLALKVVDGGVNMPAVRALP